MVAQRFALPALGWAAGRRPNRKMKRCRKLLEKCAESPVSGARFVRPHDWQKKPTDEKTVFGQRLETLLGRHHRQKTC